jgi:translation initiation factor IF-3
MVKELKVNSQIKDKIVSLITEGGNYIENISYTEALAQADNIGMDLVEIAPSNNGKLAICKILDYGKMQYDQSKKKKKVKKDVTKDIKFGLNISDHDLTVKNKKTRELLKKGNKVRYMLELKGREISQIDAAVIKVEENLEQFADVGQWSTVKKNGRSVASLIISVVK